ncbi:AraC family transcriptional regulator [Oceanobacillus salinisoli]|uniref:AraC family transcriptional regulator n=1 Tax=Oceanobacillus salinisoli TaxID=2678611 RepID=UPI0012E1E871|nr:AraC family transcriptional regulator [Oceanobacillus salinisoli]
MNLNTQTEKVIFWKSKHLESMDCLHATYVHHAFSKHAHSEFAIGVIEDGVEGFHYKGETQFGMKNNLVIINPEEVHTGYAAKTDGYTYRMIYPEKQLIEKLLGIENQTDKSQLFFKQVIITNREIVHLFLDLHYALEYSYSELEQKEKFFLFFNVLLQRFAEKSLRHVKGYTLPQQRIQLVKDYIHEYYYENITLSNLSELIGLSEYQFARTFTKQCGISPHVYLNKIRIENAKKLLEKGSNISEIAIDVGFVDQSHFSRRFKKALGVTPRQYILASKNIQY